MQVLQYTRTDTYMGNEEVVAVVLDDVASELTHSCAEVKASLESWPIQKNIQRLPGRGSAALLG